jgi:hypothetical protein
MVEIGDLQTAFHRPGGQRRQPQRYQCPSIYGTRAPRPNQKCARMAAYLTRPRRRPGGRPGGVRGRRSLNLRPTQWAWHASKMLLARGVGYVHIMKVRRVMSARFDHHLGQWRGTPNPKGLGWGNDRVLMPERCTGQRGTARRRRVRPRRRRLKGGVTCIVHAGVASPRYVQTISRLSCGDWRRLTSHPRHAHGKRAWEGAEPTPPGPSAAHPLR